MSDDLREGDAALPEDATRVMTRPQSPPATAPGEDGAAVIGSARGASPVSAPLPMPVSGAPVNSEGRSGAEAGVLSPGSRLAEFEVTHLVGQGGFGAVYEAWDHTLERVVAIKEYLPLSLSARQSDGAVVPLSERTRETFDLGMRSFINEARLLAQFDHPSLLKVYRFWQERGTTYMVMPFYRGDTLRQALAAIPGGVDEGWLLRIMDGVTQALAVMHAANCYHRDIAPDNIILLENSGRPVVLDFGAARRVITDKTQAITVILKPGYAPIEQYAEMPDMTQGGWTDVYALAAVMHVAVTGRAPPPSVARLLSDSYAPLAQNELLRERYSAQLLSAIDSGLGVRPESRPQSMAELRALLGLEGASALNPVHSTDPATAFSPHTSGGAAAPPSRPVPKPAVPAPRNKTAIAAASVLGLALLGGGGWWWSQQGAVAPAEATSTQSSATVATPTVEPAPPPPPAAPPPRAVARTPVESLEALAAGAAAGFEVSATPRKAEVSIGKDKLAFEIRSQRDGYAYVFLLSSAGEMFLLFPNLLDKYNKVTAGSALSLPRASWPMDSGGPPGTNRFVVLVSERERDFSAAGVQNDGVFPQFPLPVLSALESARGSGPPPLLGTPVCADAAPCRDVYGVGSFNIVEK